MTRAVLAVALLGGTMGLAALHDSTASASSIYYVDVNGTGSSCTQTAPCGLISQAVQAAAGNGGTGTILVGAGTFNDSISVSSGNYVVSGIPGQTTLASNGSDGFDNYGATLTVTGITINGGGGYDLMADGGNTTLSGDQLTAAYDGIYQGGGAVSVNTTTISGNAVDGVYSFGTLTVRNSTITANPDNGIESYGTLTLTDSTVNANGTDGVLAGGTTTTVSADTLSANGEFGLNNQTTVNVFGTIVAGNADGSCFSSTNNNETGTPGGYNIDDGDSCGFQSYYGDQVDTDPLLGSLQDNGGPTLTQAVLPTSPAYHQIPASSCLAADQRGESRPQPADSTFCDVGAFEYSTPTSIALTSAPITGPTSAGADLGPVTVEARDAVGNPATSPDAIVLNLSSTNPQGTFSLTSGGSATPAVVIPPGSTSGSFFTGAPHPGALPVSVASGTLGTVSQTETVVTGPAATVTTTAGDGQTAVVGQNFATGLSANVVDGTDNPVAGDTVTFTVTSGPAAFAGGSSTATATTGADGTATAPALTAGTTPGAVTLTATDGAATSSSYGETVVVGPAASITDTAGDNQTATVTTDFATPLVATVADQYGNPIAGETVTFTVTGGSATFPGGATDTETTAPDGTATAATLTAGTTAGPLTVTASDGSLSTTFSDQVVVAGAADSISTTSGDAQSAAVNDDFTNPLVATVDDAYGNPVAGESVTFTVTSGSATFPGGSTTDTETTGTDGTATAATLTAGTTAGPVTVSATDANVAGEADFSATVVAGDPAAITDTGGDDQQTTPVTAFPTPLTANVVDAYGNPVSGATVTFQVTSGGGTFPGRATSVAVTTDDSGTATAPALTAGTAVGTVTTTATVDGVDPITFSDLVVVHGPAALVTVVSGNGQNALYGHPFGAPLTVKVTDAQGNPVSGNVVSFAVTGGSATLGASSATTNSSGEASVTLTAGPYAGTVTVSATPAGVHGIALTATVQRAGSGGSTIASTPDGKGYWVASPTGKVTAFGDATNEGSITGPLNKPVVGITCTPSGKGYWLVASDGGIFAFGDAGFYGSMGNRSLNQPIVGITSTTDGKGYWMVAADGGIFAFGDSTFYGSMGGQPLNQPIVAISATPGGLGYWMVAADGGIFSFGDAGFYGSMGATHLNQPIVGMAITQDGKGYWMVAADGGIFSLGDAGFYGSLGGQQGSQPIVGMAATPTGKGYWLVGQNGSVFALGNAQFYGTPNS